MVVARKGFRSRIHFIVVLGAVATGVKKTAAGGGDERQTCTSAHVPNILTRAELGGSQRERDVGVA